MRILNTAPYYWPVVGGLENVAKQITDRLNEREELAVVPVASCSCEQTNQTHRLDEQTIHLRTDARVFHTPLGLDWRSQLQTLIREERIDIVLTHTPVPFMADVAVRAAHREGVPSILFHHNDLDPRTFLHRAAIETYRRILGDKTLALADRILVTSEAYAQESADLDGVLDKVDVVPPGVDTDRFSPDNANAEDHDGSPEIVLVGRLDETSSHKGILVLLEALSRLTPELDFQLSIVGEGDARASYEQQSEDLGIGDRCNFHGFVSDEKLASIYARAHIVCLPSTTRSEGFGLVLLEAQASGTPVVGSNIGGIPQAIAHEQTGLLVEPGSIESLADKLGFLLENPELAEAMGRKGRKHVLEQFSWEATADRLVHVLEQAHHGSPSASKPLG